MDNESKVILWFLAITLGAISLNNLVDKALAKNSACESEP